MMHGKKNGKFNITKYPNEKKSYGYFSMFNFYFLTSGSQ